MLTRHNESLEITQIETADTYFSIKNVFNLSTDWAKLNATITDHNLYLTTVKFSILSMGTFLIFAAFFVWIVHIVSSISWDIGGLGRLCPHEAMTFNESKNQWNTSDPHPPNTRCKYDPPAPRAFYFQSAPPPPPQYITKTVFDPPWK